MSVLANTILLLGLFLAQPAWALRAPDIQLIVDEGQIFAFTLNQNRDSLLVQECSVPHCPSGTVASTAKIPLIGLRSGLKFTLGLGWIKDWAELPLSRSEMEEFDRKIDALIENMAAHIDSPGSLTFSPRDASFEYALLKNYLDHVVLWFAPIEAGTFIMGSPASEDGRGRDEAQHQVILNRGFEMQVTEVAQLQFVRLMGKNPSFFKKREHCEETHLTIMGVGLCPHRPVENISWNDAQEFLYALNRQNRDGYLYRLPTEAEWEYAARAGTQTAFNLGEAIYALGAEQFNFRRQREERGDLAQTGGRSRASENTKLTLNELKRKDPRAYTELKKEAYAIVDALRQKGQLAPLVRQAGGRVKFLELLIEAIAKRSPSSPKGSVPYPFDSPTENTSQNGATVAVKSLPNANAWGLYGMHGNVAEWVEDSYTSYPEVPVTDPVGVQLLSDGRNKVVRGGSWQDPWPSLRSASRFWKRPSERSSGVGFRLLRVPREAQ